MNYREVFKLLRKYAPIAVSSGTNITLSFETIRDAFELVGKLFPSFSACGLEEVGLYFENKRLYLHIKGLQSPFLVKHSLDPITIDLEMLGEFIEDKVEFVDSYNKLLKRIVFNLLTNERDHIYHPSMSFIEPLKNLSIFSHMASWEENTISAFGQIFDKKEIMECVKFIFEEHK